MLENQYETTKENKKTLQLRKKLSPIKLQDEADLLTKCEERDMI